MTVTTFWSTEINFGPFSTNGGSIRFPYTILVPSQRSPTGLCQKYSPQTDLSFLKTTREWGNLRYFRGLCGQKYRQKGPCRPEQRLVFGALRAWGCVVQYRALKRLRTPNFDRVIVIFHLRAFSGNSIFLIIGPTIDRGSWSTPFHGLEHVLHCRDQFFLATHEVLCYIPRSDHKNHPSWDLTNSFLIDTPNDTPGKVWLKN